MKMMTYGHALQLYKVYNSEEWIEEWMDLIWQQNFNSRSNKVQIIDSSRNKVGKNKLINRLKIVSNKIEFAWLNQSFDTFKVRCKELFLS